MGNQPNHSIVNHRSIALDRPDGIYSLNDVVSGKVSHLRVSEASIVLTGVVHVKKQHKKRVERRRILFFSTECPLNPSPNGQHCFQLHLREDLPPSSNRVNTIPNVSYSIGLIFKTSQKRLDRPLAIRICPRVQVNRPLLCAPLFFGPVENQETRIKLEVKLDRAVFTFDDLIHLYYELRNPSEVYIHRMQVSLGVYYSVDSNVCQEDVSFGMENLPIVSWKGKLRRNKVLLNIPEKIYLPPTFDYKHGHDGDSEGFHLTIDYKIQFKIYLSEKDDLWQVDVPIVLCHDLVENQPLPVDASSWSRFDKWTFENDESIFCFYYLRKQTEDVFRVLVITLTQRSESLSSSRKETKKVIEKTSFRKGE